VVETCPPVDPGDGKGNEKVVGTRGDLKGEREERSSVKKKSDKGRSKIFRGCGKKKGDGKKSAVGGSHGYTRKKHEHLMDRVPPVRII